MVPPGLTGEGMAVLYGSIKTTLWKQKSTKGTKHIWSTNKQ